MQFAADTHVRPLLPPNDAQAPFWPLRGGADGSRGRTMHSRFAAKAYTARRRPRSMVGDANERITVTVNNAEVELDLGGELGETEVRVILERSGYAAEEYDLFIADDADSEPLAPGTRITVTAGIKFHAIRRSNPYGS